MRPCAWRDRDLAVLWHPCTQMREHPRHAAAAADRARRRRVAGRPRRPPLPGCGQQLVDQPVRPRRAAHRRGHRRARRATLEQVILAGCSHAPAVELAERLLAIAPRQAGPRAAGQGVLCRQRLGRRGSRAEDGVPLVPQPRRAPAHQVHRAGERLPRRNHRRAGGRRHSAVPARLCAAAGRSAVRALARCLPARDRRIAGRACAQRAADALARSAANVTPARSAR